jgi:hypothetical protein
MAFLCSCGPLGTSRDGCVKSIHNAYKLFSAPARGHGPALLSPRGNALSQAASPTWLRPVPAGIVLTTRPYNLLSAPIRVIRGQLTDLLRHNSPAWMRRAKFSRAAVKIQSPLKNLRNRWCGVEKSPLRK